MANMIGQFVLISALLIVLAGVAGAYTIVFRDGRRVEVTSGFTLTKSTFTYEVAPGINKTLELILIDVAATERANNEAPGSFFKHSEQNLVPVPPPLSQHAQRTLSNRDLEPIQQRRIESEKNYEKRRIQLGLPSVEETRRRQAQEEEATLALMRERAAQQTRDEAYWRGRAAELRNQISTIDAQINYLRSRLVATQDFPLATHSLVTGVLPLAPLNTTSAIVGPRILNPGVFVAPRAAAANQRGQVFNSPGPAPFRGPRLARPLGGFGFAFGLLGGTAFPFGSFGYVEDSYAATNLSDRLNSLLVTRAGLEALGRELEDQARDAKVPQVWLEP
jgi:hypothetical protein